MNKISTVTLLDGTQYEFGGAGGGAKLVTVSIGNAWNGSGPYTQIVTVPGGTENSIVDLHPDYNIISTLSEGDTTALYVQNDNGVFTAYALGAAPTAALTVQATVTEVTG